MRCAPQDAREEVRRRRIGDPVVRGGWGRHRPRGCAWGVDGEGAELRRGAHQESLVGYGESTGKRKA
eukprot:458280-Hanusia_phi.AAC.2